MVKLLLERGADPVEPMRSHGHVRRLGRRSQADPTWRSSLRRQRVEITGKPGPGQASPNFVGLAKSSRKSPLGALIEAILLEPDDDELKITLKDDLAGMLSAPET